MQVWSTLISLFVILLTAGCPYHTPLTEDHTIPIDKELLGYWYECDTNKYDLIESQAQKALGQSGLSKNKKTEGGVLVMPFSETEYVIRYLPSSGDGPVFLRGYPIEVGGVSCVQLQTIGPVNMDPSAPYVANWESNRYAVAKYEIKGDTLEVAFLNKDVVSDKSMTPKALRAAFLENIDHPELFTEIERFRDSGAHEDRRLLLEPKVKITDKTLTTTACANPVNAEFAAITLTGEVRIYDYDGKVISSLKTDRYTLRALAYSSDGKQLLAGTKEGDLLVWNRGTPEWRMTAEQVADKIDRVAWLGGTNSAVWASGVGYYGTNSNPVNRDKPSGGIIDTAAGETKWSFMAKVRSDYQTLASSPNGKRLAVLEIPGKKRAAFILDGATGQIQSTLYHKQHGCGPLSVSIAPDNKTVAVGYAPYDIILWDADEEKLLRILEGHSNWVVSLAFSPDGKLLISGAGDSTARIWSVETGEELGRIRFPGSSTYVHSVGFSPDGKKAFALTEDNYLRIVDVPDPGQLH